ncbi:MAG: hypothetical protein PVF37_23215, partial [Desulfobacterales bacterium]
NLLGLVWKSAVVGFRISQYHRQNVGWVECNETQQSLEYTQTNLQHSRSPRIDPSQAKNKKFLPFYS